jgi:hypothetical protein
MRCKACVLTRRLANKAPLLPHAQGRDVLGRDVLPQASGRLWPRSSAPETLSAAGLERRVSCAADIPVTVEVGRKRGERRSEQRSWPPTGPEYGPEYGPI